jgi:hypothetical protein
MKTIAWILTIWGGVGVLNQFMLQSATSGGTAPTAALNSFDPAVLLQITATPGAAPSITSTPMLVDAGILGVGLFLHYKGRV